MQTKLGSFVEALANTLVGLVFAFVAQAAMFALSGIQATATQNLIVVIGMTVVSVVRTYIIRRLFNGAWATNVKSTLLNWKGFLG